MKPLSYVGDIDILILIDGREFLKISILKLDCFEIDCSH